MTTTTTKESELNILARIYGRDAQSLTGDAGQYTEFSLRSSKAKVEEAERVLASAQGNFEAMKADVKTDIERRKAALAEQKKAGFNVDADEAKLEAEQKALDEIDKPKQPPGEHHPQHTGPTKPAANQKK